MIRPRLRGGERKAGTAKRTCDAPPSERPRKSRRRERDADAAAGAKVRTFASTAALVWALRIFRSLTCVVLAQDEAPNLDSDSAGGGAASGAAPASRPLGEGACAQFC